MTSPTGRGQTLRERLPTVDVAMPSSGVAALALLDRIRVSRRDVTAFGAPGHVSAALAAPHLWRALVQMDKWWPEVSLRDSVGWALVHESLWVPRAGDLMGRVLPYAEVGLVENGWLFAAAGLSPEEAAERVASGTADEDALAALAALRDVAVPVTS